MVSSQFSFRPVVLACVMALGVLSASMAQAQTTLNGSSKIRLSGNKQRGTVQTRGGKGGVGADVVGKIDLTGFAHANSVALRGQDVRNSQVRVHGNQSDGQISSMGALAAANSVVADGGGKGRVSLHDSHVVNARNRAKEVHASGGSGSVAAGAVASVNKPGRSLANSQEFAQSDVKNTRSAIIGNQAEQISADGGSALANSVLARASRLEHAQVQHSGNRASHISAQGGQGSVGGGAVANVSVRSMAAANSLSVRDSKVGGDTRIVFKGNEATQVDASGGTAFVNSVAAYGQSDVQGSTVVLEKNTARNVRTQGASKEVLGGGRSKNGILVANGVYAEGNEGAQLSRAHVAIRNNRATDLHADGGRINANALAINARGKVQGGTVVLADNRASQISSQGTETTAAGFAALDRGVGNSHANAVQINGQARDSRISVARNEASHVSASKGVAAANSVTTGADATLDGARIRLAGNVSTRVQADERKTALAASLHNEGRISQSGVHIANNRTSAKANRDDAVIASVHNRSGGSIEGNSTLWVQGNQGSVADRGQAHSVDNRGQIRASRLVVVRNRGDVRDKGSLSSIENSKDIRNSTIVLADNARSSVAQDGLANSVRNSGTLENSTLIVARNRAQVQSGGQANSVENTGQMRNSTVVIADNHARVTGDGMVNSLKNTGRMQGSTVALLGNKGSSTGGGKINSVDNGGQMTGNVVIAGNRGTVGAGGVVNSVVNQGDISGTVLIAGNTGAAGAGGIANSVINKGRINGMVAIVGNNTVAAAGMTSGGVQVNHGGTVHGAAGVAGGVAWSANKGVAAHAPPTGVIQQSVIVGGAGDRVFR